MSMVMSKQDIRSLCCMQPDELHEARDPPGRKANAAKEPLSIKVDLHAKMEPEHLIGQIRPGVQTKSPEGSCPPRVACVQGAS